MPGARRLAKLRKTQEDYTDFWQSFDLDIRSGPTESGELSVRCPFHEDNTPSLYANVNTGEWHCFACDARGLSPSGGGPKVFVQRWLRETKGEEPDPKEVEEELRTRLGGPKLPSEEEIRHWTGLLRSTPTVKAYLSRRGLPLERLEELGLVDRHRLGFDGRLLTVPVEDANGSLLFVKRLHASELDGKEAKNLVPKGSRPALWPIRDLLESAEGDLVVIAEGEIDALTAMVQGYRAVTSTGGAASRFGEWAPLFRKRRVLIAYDGDEAGRKGAYQLAGTLRPFAAEIKILRMPDGEDVNSLWVKGTAIADLLDRAEIYIQPTQRLITGTELAAIMGEELKRPWIVEGILHPGVLAVLSGNPKTAKTLLVAHLMRAVQEGIPFLGHATHPTWVIYGNYEMSGLDLGQLYMEVFGDDVTKWPLTIYDPERPIHVSRLAMLLREEAAAWGREPGLLVIDSARAAFGLTGDRENNSGDVGAILRDIQWELCRTLGWTVLVIHHNRKDSWGNSPMAMAGSGEWMAAPDILMTWERKGKTRGDFSGKLHIEGRIPELDDIPVDLHRADGKTSIGLKNAKQAQADQNTYKELAGEARELLEHAGGAGIDMTRLASALKVEISELVTIMRQVPGARLFGSKWIIQPGDLRIGHRGREDGEGEKVDGEDDREEDESLW